MYDRVYRKLRHDSCAFGCPTVKFSSQTSAKNLTHVIAITGCDGAGKSTLAAGLFAHLHDKVPMESLYLGQSSGNIADWIRSLPLIGPALGRYLVRKAKNAHSKKRSTPNYATVLAIYFLSLWRAHKFRRMLAMNRRGLIVITDRYPQAEVPGFYFDGPGLGAIKSETWLARTLMAREQKLYEWMAHHVPALVIRINIDAGTALARKPDHDSSMLQDKVSVIPDLHFNHAKILDLDGRDPYEQVLDAALNASHAVIDTLTDRDAR